MNPDPQGSNSESALKIHCKKLLPNYQGLTHAAFSVGRSARFACAKRDKQSVASQLSKPFFGRLCECLPCKSLKLQILIMGRFVGHSVKAIL